MTQHCAGSVLSSPVAAIRCLRECGPFVNVAELGLLLAAVVLPLILGVIAALMKRPWWWAAIVAVLVAMVAAIAPTPRARGSAIRGGGRSVPAYRRRRGVRAGVVGVVRDAPIAATGRRRNSSGGKAKQDHLNLSER